MTRRCVALMLLALSALVLQSAISSVLPSAYVPDLSLLLVVAAALYVEPILGLSLAFVAGYGTDMLSGAPAGHHALLRMLAFSVTAAVAMQFHLARPLALAFFVLLLSVADAGGTAGLAALFGGRFPLDLGVIHDLGIHALVNAGFAPLVSTVCGALLTFVTEGETRRSVRIEAKPERR